MTYEYKEAYFESLWNQHRPSNRLPVEFEKKLKESVFVMLELAWNASCASEKNRIKAEFSDFVDRKPAPYFHSPIG
jgi:hypothetical protein